MADLGFLPDQPKQNKKGFLDFLPDKPTGIIPFLKKIGPREVISTPEGDFPIERIRDPEFRAYLGEKYGIPESYWREPKTFGEHMARQTEPTEAFKWGIGILPITGPRILEKIGIIRGAKEVEKLRPVAKPYATVPITPVEAGKPVGLGVKTAIEVAKPAIEIPKPGTPAITKPRVEDVTKPEVLDELTKINQKLKTELEASGKKMPADMRTGEFVLEPHVKFEPHKEMAEAGTESMITKGVKRDPKKLMTEQLVEEWLAHPSKYQEIASKYGLTVKEFASKLREEASWHGKYLGEIGLQSQKLGREIPEIGEVLTELERVARTPGPMDFIQSGWKKFSNIWRGMLVTQTSTAMRNAEVQAGRVGLNVFEEGLNAGLQKALGKPQTVKPLDGVEQLFKLFQRNKPLTEKVLKEFPKQYDRLFATYMSDIESAGKIGGTLSKGVDIANTLNRFQEYTIRRAVFMGKLEQSLKAQGMDLVQIIEKNEIGKIPLDSIKGAVNKSLEFTFASQPQYGTLGKKFTDFVTSMPGATLVMPFPRFLMNSLKFQFEYSPLGPLKLLSTAERQAFAAGNMEVISRAMLGTAMLGAAWQIRNSKYAGEKWYQLEIDGKPIDMRPFNPFVSYLFIADIMKKSTEGNLHRLTSKDIAMGVFSSNLRAGTGLYALDKILDGITSTGDSQKAVDLIKQFGGEIAGGFLTPLNQFKEFATGLDDYIVREKRSEPFLGPIKEKMPILEKTLPPAYSPTHKGPLVRKYPAIRQATGIMIGEEKNEFEKELDKLGFERRDILPSTGNPEADNLVAKHMGVLSEERMVPFTKSKEYKQMNDRVRAYYLNEHMKNIRAVAIQRAKLENPTLFLKLRFEKMPRREKEVFQSGGINIHEITRKIGKKDLSFLPDQP